ANTRPWLLKKADHFRPGPPPALSSEAWARDYNEVKSLGGVKSTARTPEQTEAVKFWGNTNFGPSWQTAARHLSGAKELGLADTARVFALLNMSLANNYVLNWDAKYHYMFWRPVTAIRNGDIDGNDATERDPGWTPLNMTPMHPEYPSQATINATVAAAILESVFGPVSAIPLTVSDAADAKRTRHFASIADMVEEQKNVRIWGGVHYRSAIDTGAEMGRKVAAYMMDNALKPAP
ncbi:MAG TPA: vanadium-dependent haloperoxidase, partial [Beijerinckiaceae bacterium]|nr:vanadium-dependent haloperoxidase [Beijerinckiaceae bacterium]